MPDTRPHDQQWRQADLERQLALLRVENQRLRNLLRVTDGVEPPPEQPTLAPSDPGLVTNASPPGVKLALSGGHCLRPQGDGVAWIHATGTL